MSDNPLKSYFSFTRRERYGIAALLLAIGVLVAVRWYIGTIQEDHFDTIAQQRYKKYYNQYVAAQAKAAQAHRNDTAITDLFDTDAPDSIKALTIVHINTVDSVTLVNLKGIGPAKAHSFLVARAQKGTFTELKAVKDALGLSEKQFEVLAPYIQL